MYYLGNLCQGGYVFTPCLFGVWFVSWITHIKEHIARKLG